jgi:hypothetical protein
MNYSQHNIFSAIKNSENYFIVNLLSGNADILSNSEAEELNKIIKGNEITDTVFVKELITKGYLVETEEEKKAY